MALLSLILMGSGSPRQCFHSQVGDPERCIPHVCMHPSVPAAHGSQDGNRRGGHALGSNFSSKSVPSVSKQLLAINGRVQQTITAARVWNQQADNLA